MKILQIIQRPQRRGAEIFACQLSEELVKLGHSVDMAFVFSNESNELDFDLSFIPLHGNAKRRFLDFTAYKRLAHIIRDGEYDLVQANAGDTLKYASLSKRLFGWKAPLVFRNANYMSSFIRGKIHKQLNTVFLSACDYHISVSENCRQDLIRLYPRARDCSRAITIGTYNFDHIQPENADPSIHPRIINIGGLVPEKNQQFLIEWFATIKPKYPKAELWIFGDGRLRDTLSHRIEELNLADSITLWGNQKNVISFLKATDIMVMPSKIEGLPGVILEAMSVGVPVVAASVGGISEVIENGVTGFLPSGYEPHEYTKALESLLNPEVGQKVVHNARQRISKEFLLPIIAKQFEETYLTLTRLD